MEAGPTFGTTHSMIYTRKYTISPSSLPAYSSLYLLSCHDEHTLSSVHISEKETGLPVAEELAEPTFRTADCSVFATR